MQSVVAFQYEAARPLHTAEYLSQPIIDLCRQLSARRVLDLGCGNGAFCCQLADEGFEVAGIDASEDGILMARKTRPDIPFHRSLIDADPPEGLGRFDVVVSTEVVEHLYSPRDLPRFATKVLNPGGCLILSTPYHGYLKNLALAVSNGWDRHVNPLWDGGHIKFWSKATLSQLLEEEGFMMERFIGVGRLPWLWKSMICMAKRAEDSRG